MKNTVTPIKNAWGKVIDFVVEHECEACKKRRAKMKAFFNRDKRDLLRQPKRR